MNYDTTIIIYKSLLTRTKLVQTHDMLNYVICYQTYIIATIFYFTVASA